MYLKGIQLLTLTLHPLGVITWISGNEGIEVNRYIFLTSRNKILSLVMKRVLYFVQSSLTKSNSRGRNL